MTINAGTTTTATVIKNAAGGATVTAALPLGSSVFDTATVTPTPTGTGFTPTGSAAYTFFTSVDCTTGGTAAGGGALVAGVPPNSNTEGPLAAGSYSFRAIFTSGDSNFGGSTSVCEPLTINAGTTTTATVIKNVVGGATVTGALPLGSSVFDTATVTPTPTGTGFTPTGSVAYTFFTSVDCTTGGTAAGGGALVSGVPPQSSTRGPLGAGSYSFRAIFTSGDSNFGGSTSVCEPLTINAGTTTTATVIKNAAGGATVTGALPLGSSVFDTATVTAIPATLTPTGMVAYTFFSNGTCDGTGTAAGGGALVGGVPPQSSTRGPLAAGSYSFQAIYSGDANVGGSTSVCEPLTISAGTTVTATVIKNAVGGATVTGALPLGSSVFDTATVTPTPAGFTPTGSVAYTFFSNGTCDGTGTAAGGGALVAGLPPNSNTEGPLAAGSYGLEAVYSGDANYAGSTSVCEPLTISAGTTVTATVIKNAVGGATVTGALPLGSSVFDTATVTPTPTGTGFTPTGSVAYTFFTSVDCTTGGTAAGGGALVAGLPPNSNTEGPLAAGSYSFRATFTSGNGNFGTSTSVCEPLTISAGTTVTATVIKNAAGGATVTGALPLGSSVFDTATVTPTPAGFTPMGSVAYTFFGNGTCDGTGSGAGGGALVAGLPPNSNTEGPLAAGSYSFRAIFTSGDSNFGASTSVCEPLTISAGTTVTATVIKNAAGGATVTGALPLGSSVFDTATVTPTPAGFTPTGSVAYTFFSNGTCDGTGTAAGGGALVAGLPPNSNTEGPLAAGSYGLEAVYSGDANYAGSTSVCEPLTISAGTTVTATVIKNAVGGATVTGALPLGSSVFDTATVTPTPTGTGFTPTGSVAYTFFTSVDCTTGGTAAGGGALVAGLPPNSNTEGPLAAGSYSFQAIYSGDANVGGSTSVCEPLTISAGTTVTATVIKNAAGGATVTGALPLGSSVFDTATVTPTPAGFTPTGSVAYTFFSNGTCDGTGTAAGGGARWPGCHPTRTRKGRWPLALTAWRLSIAVTPTMPVRPVFASR